MLSFKWLGLINQDVNSTFKIHYSTFERSDLLGLWPAALDRINRIFQNLLGLRGRCALVLSFEC